MSHHVTRRIPRALREPMVKRFAVVAVFCFLLSLILAGAANSPLPDSVLACVPCHNRQESNQVAEWLASPYSESEGGRGCTSCHVGRCSGQANSHTLDEETAARATQRIIEAARVTVRATCSGDAVNAEVAVSNVGVGHLLPSGPTDRTLLLEVTAQDRNQTPLLEWNRDPNPSDSDSMAGAMGRLTAEQALPGSSVTVQQRLLPFATEVSRHRFAAPDSGPVRISARLLQVPATGPLTEIANTTTVCRPSGEVP
jgi:hypothetical protein